MVSLFFLPPNRNDTKEDVFVHQVRGILAVILTYMVCLSSANEYSILSSFGFLESALSSTLLSVVDKPSYPIILTDFKHLCRSFSSLNEVILS